MKTLRNFTAIIEKEDEGYVALCTELDIASQGNSVEDAKNNLREAIELFFEYASDQEVERRLKGDIFITSFLIPVGQAQNSFW